MTATRLPSLGSVVWAEVDDPNGFRKLRPAMVVTATAGIARGKSMQVAAVTTRLPDPLPAVYVLLPWNQQGTAPSGLRRRCAAVASWLCSVSVDDVKIAGILPPSLIAELLAKIAAARPNGGAVMRDTITTLVGYSSPAPAAAKMLLITSVFASA